MVVGKGRRRGVVLPWDHGMIFVSGGEEEVRWFRQAAQDVMAHLKSRAQKKVP